LNALSASILSKPEIDFWNGVSPLDTLEEKTATLTEAAADEKMILFFEHDPLNEACTVMQTEKGVRIKEQVLLCDL
jgi:hypothetical protein